jgi:N-acyl-D-amino-acid deacylase
MPASPDLLIESVTVVDGTGAPRFVASVGLQDGAIAWISRTGPHGDDHATRTLSGEGLVLAPGFIDVHNHSDLGALVDPEMPSTLLQGVTTVVVGNCGSSPWPVAGAIECAQLVGGDPATMDLTFPSFGGYLDRLDAARPAVNVAALVGHGAIRAQIMGSERRAPTGQELRSMCRAVAGAMDDGALGLSTGLIYAPGMYAHTDEVVALAMEAASRGGIYASHIRGEGEHLFRAVDEAIEIGRGAGGPAHVSHLKCETSLVWGRAGELLERFHGDDDVTGDQYPYAAWASVLWSLLPEWAPVDEVGQIWGDPDRRALLARAIEEGEGDAFQSSVRGVGWDRIVIEATADASCNGMSIEAIAHERAIAPVDACIQLLIEEPQTACIGHAMAEDDVRTIMADPDVMVASDASSMSPTGPLGTLPVHPRNYGTFPRVLGRYVHDNVLALETAVRKMTSLPADRFGVPGRGRIVPGAVADLVLFDPDRVHDRADFDTPHAFPDGIRAVIVNGAIAWSVGTDGVERAGRVLRRS